MKRFRVDIISLAVVVIMVAFFGFALSTPENVATSTDVLGQGYRVPTVLVVAVVVAALYLVFKPRRRR